MPSRGRCWHQARRGGGAGAGRGGRRAWLGERPRPRPQAQGRWGGPHLSLLHLWAPFVMVKPPVSSCWMCMASRRAEGRVGGARDRRPSIRHRLSLFRKTWPPSRAGQEDRPGSVLGAPPAAGSARPVPGGARALTHGPGWAHLGRWGRGWEVQVSQARRLWDAGRLPPRHSAVGSGGAQPPEGERGASRPAAGPLGCQPRTPPPPRRAVSGVGHVCPPRPHEATSALCRVGSEPGSSGLPRPVPLAQQGAPGGL